MAEPVDDAQRGADAVRAALIEAAATRLSEAGPSSVSVREVARRAGVNHGQVHHYFGGKRGLLIEAMRKLARDHLEKIGARSADGVIPPAFALADDPGYWRAVCQVMMEGDLELARIEVDEGLSVPRRALDALMERYDIAPDDLDFKARFAAITALQLGWVALEDFIMLVSDVADEDREQVRQRAKRLLEEWVARSLASARG
jgi:AcrR family transcriptional regulator